MTYLESLAKLRELSGQLVTVNPPTVFDEIHDAIVDYVHVQQARLDDLKSERDLARLQRDRIQNRLRWSNVNHGQAYVLRGVGEHDLWPLLSGKLDEKGE